MTVGYWVWLGISNHIQQYRKTHWDDTNINMWTLRQNQNGCGRSKEPTRERKKNQWRRVMNIHFFSFVFSFQLNNNIIKIWKSNWRIDRFRPVHRWQHMKWSLNGQTMTRATTTTITTFKMVSIKSINAAWYRVGTTDSTYNQTFLFTKTWKLNTRKRSIQQ